MFFKQRMRHRFLQKQPDLNAKWNCNNVPTPTQRGEHPPSHVKYTECRHLAGGCFWCLEAVFVRLHGVESVRSGYCGGHLANPTYQQVCAEITGHTEAVEISFDPAMISYANCSKFFSRSMTDHAESQGHDSGTQYRSASLLIRPSRRQCCRDHRRA